MAEADAVVDVDARGMKCPWPVLRLSRAMREKTTVLIVADDPIAPGEIAAVSDEQGWTVETVETPIGEAFRVTR